MDKIQAWAVIKYLPKKSMAPKEIYEDMVETLVDDTSSYSTVKKWAEEYKEDDT